ncbi:MAG TPA: DUF58 domain-containing protein [Aestuariivirgaceae bacterium]|jgi:uncharacterized protein (DUF58 family)
MSSTALKLRDEAEQLSVSAPALLITAQRIAQTIIQGTHGRRTSGPGEDFWQYRLYTSGDPANRIDWRKSARSQKVLIRENEWAAANTLWLWVDGSAGMRFRSRLAPAAKGVRASLLAMALAILAVRAGERVGLLGSGLVPGHTRNSLARLSEDLAAPPQDFPEHAQLSRFSTCVLLSDFLEPAHQIGDKLVPVAAQVHTGHLIQIADPAEESFPYRGRTEFTEMAGIRNLTFGRAETMKEDYQALYRQQRAAVKDLAHRLGWTFTVHHTDASPLNLLLSLYMLVGDETYRPTYRAGAA